MMGQLAKGWMDGYRVDDGLDELNWAKWMELGNGRKTLRGNGNGETRQILVGRLASLGQFLIGHFSAPTFSVKLWNWTK